MNLRGPILTLLAVVTLAVVLLLVNMRTATETATQITIPPATTQVPATPQAQASAPPQSPADAQPPAAASEADASEPAPPAAADQTAYAGRTSGNEATIAIVVQGDQVAAYVCDGNQVEAWLEGTITGGELNLQGNDAGATGSVSGDAIFGTVQVQGKQWPYAAQRAESPAGLYQGRGTVGDEPARVGWIVLQDGTQTGTAKIGGTTRPAPALDPGQLTGVEVDGATIVPRPVTATDPVVGPPA